MKLSTAPTRSSGRKIVGDFPTPPGLVAEILAAPGLIGGRYPRVLEPTCGRGHFVAGLLALAEPPREIRGFELQPGHAEAARALAGRVPGVRLVVETADLFAVDLARDVAWAGSGPLLVVGNLPWVTVAGLGASGADGGPARVNARGARGIDAMTGASNFDISEALWLKLVRELAPQRPTIALLCKTAVARAVLRAVATDDLPIVAAEIRRVDALRWFRAAVDACLLRVEVGPGPKATEAPVYRDLAATEPESRLGLGAGGLIADVEAYARSSFADGACPIAWRQGVKHDAAAVMELTVDAGGSLRNKRGEVVDVEPDFVFPLLKGTDLAGGSRPRPRLAVLVTHRRLGEDTRPLERRAPKLWAYLTAHSARFEARKSSIYRGRPPFSLFGIGDYAFAPYKVAISGLHKTPRFRAIGPVAGRPTLLDDTSYFLPCRTPEQAAILAATLNGDEALDLVRALVFPDAKRPITKAVLRRIDPRPLLARADAAGLQARAEAEWKALTGGRPGSAPASGPLAWQDDWAADFPDRPTHPSR